MENSEAWKRLSAIAAAWDKGGNTSGSKATVEGGSQQPMILGLDLVKEALEMGDVSAVSKVSVRQNDGGAEGVTVEDVDLGKEEIVDVDEEGKDTEEVLTKIDDVDEADFQKDSDREQLNMVKAAILGVDRRSLVPDVGSGHLKVKDVKKSWADVDRKSVV